MASAAGGAQEGTTMSLCEACENVPPEMHCRDCPMKLCNSCVKIHQKIKATSLHVITNLSELDLDSVTFEEREPGLTKCSIHEEYFLEFQCQECVLLICEECKPEHKYHSIENVKDDVEMHQAICRKHVQCLFENYHELEKFKKQVNVMIVTNDDTKTKIDEWEFEIMTLLKDTADKRRAVLAQNRAILENIITDPTKGLIRAMDEIDGGIPVLHNLRKVTDCGVLSQQLAESQKLLISTKQFSKNSCFQGKMPSISDMLPHESELNSVKQGIQKLLSVSKWFVDYDITRGTGSFDTLKLIDDIKIEDPETRHGFRFSKSDCPEDIIIHGDATDDIRMVNLVTGSSSAIKSDVKIWSMVYANNEGVVKECSKNILHLLDKDMKLKCSIQEVEGTLKAVYNLSTNRYVKLVAAEPKTIFSPHKGKLITFRTKNMSFVQENEIEFDVEDEPRYFKLSQCGGFAYILSHNALYRVNIHEADVHKHSLANIVSGNPVSLFVDKYCNIFIGDRKGNVHHLDETFVHKSFFRITDTWARDIAVIDGRVVVTTSDNRILIYG